MTPSFLASATPVQSPWPPLNIQPQQPADGWDPKQIVQGFLTASASFGNYSYIAREYLTPQEAKDWNPFWSAIVYKSCPNVENPVYSSLHGTKAGEATVQVPGRRGRLPDPEGRLDPVQPPMEAGAEPFEAGDGRLAP